MRAALAGCSLLAWVITAPVRAQSEPLVIALEAYQSGELDVALERFDEALRVPGNAPAELVQIHLHLGILRAIARETEAARRDMDAALAIEPTLQPPSEMGPDARALFETVRQARGGRAVRLTATAAGPVRNDAATTLRVAIADAPPALIASVRVLAAPPSSEEPAVMNVAGVPPTVEIPASVWAGGRALVVVVEGLDEHGGSVVRGEARLDALLPGREAAGASGREVGTDDGGGFWASPWPWIGLVALVAAGVTAGVLLFGIEDAYTVGAPEVTP